MTSWRNSARAGDSIRDFIFDFGSGKDSTTVLPSHMLIEPCSFWAAAKPSNFFHIDQLWGIDFGDGMGKNGPKNRLFFTAGPDSNFAGTLGSIAFK